jgi:hypothetical protein
MRHSLAIRREELRKNDERQLRAEIVSPGQDLLDTKKQCYQLDHEGECSLQSFEAVLHES